jgi:membrane carboxypeptidase/penicillin-binding protein
VTFPRRRSKYGNVKTEVDGIRFDSLKESRRYALLKLALETGAITHLRLQVPYALHIVGGIKLRTYIADFVYEQDGVTVVEDVKSEATRKDRSYRLKKAWMKLEHGITIHEW